MNMKMLEDMEFTINLFTEGDLFFDLLKAFIRDSKNSQWPHERERTAYAKQLFQNTLKTYENGVLSLENRIQQGFHTEQDKKMVKGIREKYNYWKKKYDEVVNDIECSC